MKMVKLMFADWLIIVSLILMVFNHSATQFLINKHTTIEQTQQQADNLIKLVEANPVGALMLQLNKFRYIYSFFIVPGTLIGFYYYIRKKYFYNKDVLNMWAIMIFTTFALNFLNDFSALMGFLFR